MEQTAPMMKATLTFGLAFAFFAAAVGAQAQQDNFREIGSEHADKTELLSCSVRSDVPDSAYVILRKQTISRVFMRDWSTMAASWAPAMRL